MRITIGTAAFVILAALAAGQSRLIGVYELKPQLLHPSIISELPPGGRFADGMKLSFHKTVPLEVELIPGKRPAEYGMKSKPRLNIRKFILPGLLNTKLKYGRRKTREHRWEVYEDTGGVAMRSQSGTLLNVAGNEIFFLDLNHDGAFGGPSDGYVVKPRKKKQWIKYGEELDLRTMLLPYTLDGEKVWFEVDRDGYKAIVTAQKPKYEIEKNEEYARALEYLNELRAKLGFNPVAIDPSLSTACEKHSLYCATHGQTHDEEKDKSGYSAEGARAGKAGVLTKADSMKQAVEYWLTSFFHRIDMLHPGLMTVGMGLVNGSATMDVKTTLRRVDFEPYAWPHDGQTGVHVTWLTGERPSPIGTASFGGDVAVRFGYPITLTFPSGAVTEATAKLLKDGEEVECFVSTPESPSHPKFKSNLDTVFLMARAPLSAKTSYTVEVKASFKGKPYAKRWTFETR